MGAYSLRTQGFTKHLQRKKSDGTATPAHLVAFADASKQAMAACVYLLHNGRTDLLNAKSKLPSIKENPTIPKLELNALTMITVFRALESKMHINGITIYSDSEIALAWMNPKLDVKVRVLVKNRTSEIHRIMKDLRRNGATINFGYISTTSNPAELQQEDYQRKSSKNFLSGGKDQIFFFGPRNAGPPRDELSTQKHEIRLIKPLYQQLPPPQFAKK